jgi:hypothetical protein
MDYVFGTFVVFFLFNCKGDMKGFSDFFCEDLLCFLKVISNLVSFFKLKVWSTRLQSSCDS